ncbi:MAG: hypothetical protein ABSD75_32925 [Terriglobales bacterium]
MAIYEAFVEGKLEAPKHLACRNSSYFGSKYRSCTALKSTTEVEPFLSANEHVQLKAEIDKLASGILDEAANRLIDERIEFARRTRQAQIRHLELRPEMKQKLMAISPDAFPAWLDEPCCGWRRRVYSEQHPGAPSFISVGVSNWPHRYGVLCRGNGSLL